MLSKLETARVLRLKRTLSESKLEEYFEIDETSQDSKSGYNSLSSHGESRKSPRLSISLSFDSINRKIKEVGPPSNTNIFKIMDEEMFSERWRTKW